MMHHYSILIKKNKKNYVYTTQLAWLLYTPQGIIVIMMRATIQLVFNQKIKRFLFTQCHWKRMVLETRALSIYVITIEKKTGNYHSH